MSYTFGSKAGSGSGTSVHNDLSGLQGGSSTERYHSTAAQNSLLAALAALTPTNDDVLQYKAGAWANRTMLQLKADLSLSKTDVGLGNVDNVQQQPLDSDLTAIAGLTPTDGDMLRRVDGSWTNQPMTDIKTALDLSIGDIPSLSDALNISSAGVLVEPSVDLDENAGTVTIGSDGYYALCYSAVVANQALPYMIDGQEFTPDLNTVSYIYADYNLGTPTLGITTDKDLINCRTIIHVLTVSRISDEIRILSQDRITNSLPARLFQRQIATDKYAVDEGGLILGEEATRGITLSEGVVWYGVNRFDAVALTSIDYPYDPTELWYHSGAAWTKSYITQYDNTQYDNGTDPATLTDGRYAVNWVYRSVSDYWYNLFVVLGEGDYTLTEAQASQPPTDLPSHIQAVGLLVGRIIVLKGADTAAQIDSVFSTAFSQAPAFDHEGLVNLQGGTTGQHYHLTSAQNSLVAGLAALTPTDGDMLRRVSGSWTNQTMAQIKTALNLSTSDIPNLDTYIKVSAPGVYTAPSVSINEAGGTVTLGSGEYALCQNADGRDHPLLYTIAGGVFSPTQNVVSYIYADYNGGSPTLVLTTNRNDYNYTTKVHVLTLQAVPNELHVLAQAEAAKSLPSRMLQRAVRTNRFSVESGGLILGETATRGITLTSGYVWFAVNRVTCGALNSLTDADPTEFWYHSGGNWTVSTITQYNNTQYDNGTDLATLTANRYAVNWIFRCISDSEHHLFQVAGTGDYTLAQALASQPPASLPPDIVANGILVGRIIVQKSADTATQIDSAFSTVFTQSPTFNHNDLAGLQGGTAGEYYHVTSAQNSLLAGIAALTPADNDILQRKSGAWTNRTMAQLKTDLSLSKSDVGLGNVDNVQQQPIDSDLTAIAGLTPTDGDMIRRVSGAWTNQSMSSIKTALSLSKSDVGLGNVDNTSDADKPVSTATSIALGGKQDHNSILDSIVGMESYGIVCYTSAAAVTPRQLTAGSTKVSITNPSGIDGNPTVDVVPGNFTGIPQSGITDLATTLAGKADWTAFTNINLSFKGTVADPNLGSTGSAVFRFATAGKLACLKGKITFGGTGITQGSVTYYVDLTGYEAANPTGYTQLERGFGRLFDSGTNEYLIFPIINSATQLRFHRIKVTGSYLTFESLTDSTSPTYADGDRIEFYIFYELA